MGRRIVINAAKVPQNRERLRAGGKVCVKYWPNMTFLQRRLLGGERHF
jgi:hypothetical protein